MTIEEALDLLEYGDWFQSVYNNLPESTANKVAEAIEAVAKVVRIDREKWEPCLNCKDIEKLAKHIKCWPSYCPVCGRPITDQAWAEMEKQLKG